MVHTRVTEKYNAKNEVLKKKESPKKGLFPLDDRPFKFIFGALYQGFPTHSQVHKEILCRL